MCVFVYINFYFLSFLFLFILLLWYFLWILVSDSNKDDDDDDDKLGQFTQLPHPHHMVRGGCVLIVRRWINNTLLEYNTA